MSQSPIWRVRRLLHASEPAPTALRFAEDVVAADAPPADRRLAIELDPLERCPAVGPRETPRQFPDSASAFDGLDPQFLRPGGRGIVAPSFTGRVEVVLDHLSEHRALVCRQATPVSLESLRELELQPRSGVQPGVEVLEKCVGAVHEGDAPGSDMLVDLPLHGLPAFAPEPTLICSHGQHGTKLY
jgi:hypothetical protein